MHKAFDRLGRMASIVALAGLCAASLVAAAVAQAPPSRTETAPQTAPPSDKNGRNKETAGEGRVGETLSEELSKSRGVIKPPTGIDPGIKVPAPEPHPGTTIVIPPPGTPGGDPTVIPK
jgi:hypothetical protein